MSDEAAEYIANPDEGGLERSVLRWLDEMPGTVSWTVYGLEPGPNEEKEGASILDQRYSRDKGEVIYWELLRDKLIEINEDVTEANVQRLITSIRRELSQDELMPGNQHVHKLLRKGVPFEASHGNGTTKPIYAKLINFDDLGANSFIAVNQMRVTRGHSVRPDVTLLVNGIPLIQMELKSLAQDNDYYDAIDDLHDYEAKVPRLFLPTLFNVAADTQALRYGAVGAPSKFYFPWSDAPPTFTDENPTRQVVQALLNPGTLIDLLRHFVFYEKAEGGDIKIVPRHMQYYAVHKILGRIAHEDIKRGLIWHTQGSGKSYTMLFAAQNLLDRGALSNPQVFIIVDSDKLAKQMADNLSSIGFEQSVVARKIKHLEEVIKKGQSQLVLTTMHAFQDVDANVQSNPNVVVMADEAHRFMEKQLGSKLHAALPTAWHFGFTGTPVHEGHREVDRNTFREYCPDGEDPLHVYSIRKGLEDEVILPVYFTLRHDAEWDIDEAGMDAAFDERFDHLSKDEKLAIIQEQLTPSDLGELRPRIETYAELITDHFAGIEENGWKGMVVAPSKESAALYADCLLEHWDEADLAVLYTQGEPRKDSDLVKRFYTTTDERDAIVKRFKRKEQPKLLIVHKMLLTGFDAPILKTMYLDRKLTDHNLLQAIARTNRPAEGKNNGEIVDFQGVFENLDEALSYDADTRHYAARDKDQLFAAYEKQLDAVYALFDGIEKANTQEAVQEALARVSKHPRRRQFKQGFRRLQDLYESVSPDKRLVQPTVQRKYEWLSRVWIAFRRANNRDPNPEDSVREKTRKIVEEHVDVTQVKEDFPIYKIGEKHLEAIKQFSDPAAQASSIAHTTQAHLQPRIDENPRYKKLSERVQEILSEWQGGHVGDPEAVDALERLEREAIEIEEEAEAYRPAEYATYALLTDEYGVDDSEAEALAASICDRFEDQVDRSYPGWWRNEKARRKAKVAILKTVAQKDHKELIREGFPTEALNYVIGNYADH